MKLYGRDRGRMMTGGRCVIIVKFFLLIYVLLLGGLPAGIEIPLYWKLCKTNRCECCSDV